MNVKIKDLQIGELYRVNRTNTNVIFCAININMQDVQQYAHINVSKLFLNKTGYVDNEIIFMILKVIFLEDYFLVYGLHKNMSLLFMCEENQNSLSVFETKFEKLK